MSATNDTPRSLEQFNREKGRILEFAKRLSEIAAARQDTDAIAVLERFAQRFEDNRFLVVVVGEFKRGKSTLVNALAGRSVCPVHVTPKTARLTRILATPTEEEYIEIQFRKDRKPERLLLGDASLNDLVGRDGAQHEDVASVDVYLRATEGSLPEGVILVDTPGLESLFKDHDAITKEYLPRADLILFCLSVTQPLSAKERDFLLSYRHLVPKMLVTLNHIDNAPPEERASTIDFVKQGLRDEVFGSTTDIPLYPLAARDAIRAREAGTHELLDATGVPALSARIVQILAGERGWPVLTAMAEGQRDVAVALAKQVQVERSARSAAVTPGLRARCQRLQLELRERSQRLEEEVKALIEERCEDLAGKGAGRVEKWREELKAELREFVNAHTSETDCRQQFPQQLAQHLHKWLHQYEVVLRGRFTHVSNDAKEICQAEFEEMVHSAAETLAAGNARPGLAEMVSGLDALASLGAVANCLGGSVGGYGIAHAVIEPAFAIPPGVKVLTVAAGLGSVIALIGGPVGWGIAIVGWLTAAVAGLVHSTSWRQRVVQQLDTAIDEQILPRVQTAVTTEIWTFGRALTGHAVEHIHSVETQLTKVVAKLASEVVIGQAAAQAEVKRLADLERQLQTLTSEIGGFLAGLSTDEIPADRALVAISEGTRA